MTETRLPLVPADALATSETFLRALAADAAAFLPNLAVAVIVLVVGFFLAGRAARLLGAALGLTAHVDATVRGPLVAMVRYGIVILTLVVALGQVGVQMTSLLAILGAAGLAIGLALQGTLTNIAAGIMLIWLRPFRVGDTVETAAFSGTVREIGLFVSHLETFDGLFVFAPNAALWNVWLKNHSRAGWRLLAWTVELKREAALADLGAVLDRLRAAAEPDGVSRLEASLDALTPDGQVVLVRAVVAGGAAAAVQRRMPERLRRAFVEHWGADGEPRSIQRVVPADADPSRYAGFEATGSGAPAEARLDSTARATTRGLDR